MSRRRVGAGVAPARVDRLFPLATIPVAGGAPLLPTGHPVGAVAGPPVADRGSWEKAILDEEGGSAADQAHRAGHQHRPPGRRLRRLRRGRRAVGRGGRSESFPVNGEAEQPGRPVAGARFGAGWSAGEAPPSRMACPGESRLRLRPHARAVARPSFDGPAGERGALSQLRLLDATAASRCRLDCAQPAVFASRFVQTHVRVYRDPTGIPGRALGASTRVATAARRGGAAGHRWANARRTRSRPTASGARPRRGRPDARARRPARQPERTEVAVMARLTTVLVTGAHRQKRADGPTVRPGAGASSATGSTAAILLGGGASLRQGRGPLKNPEERAREITPAARNRPRRAALPRPPLTLWLTPPSGRVTPRNRKPRARGVF